MKKHLSFLFILFMSITLLLSVLPTHLNSASKEKFNMSYVYFGSPNQYTSLVDRTNHSLHMVSPNYFDVGIHGELILTNKYQPQFVKDMHQRGIKVVPFLANHWNIPAGQQAFVNREQLSTQIANSIEMYNVDGINVDIEGVNHLYRNEHTDFVRLLRQKIPAHKEVSVAVAANPNNWQTGWHGNYDYKGLATHADYLMIMAYDEHWNGSEPGPVASYNFVKRSIEYAINQGVPKEKIVLGLSFYGRIWKTNGENNADGVAIKGRGISNHQIIPLVNKHSGKVVFDERSQTPKAVFTVSKGDPISTIGGIRYTEGDYVIWFDNEESLKRKLQFVQEYDIRGTGSWSLSQEDSSIWTNYSRYLNGADLPHTDVKEIHSLAFRDIEGSWAYSSIVEMRERGWMNGTSQTTFSPSTSLTRAQAATIFVNALELKLKEPMNDSSRFLDVPTGFWAERTIEIARQHEIIFGKGDGIFAPNEPVTREQLAAIFQRTFTFDYDSSATNPFVDVQRNGFYDSILATYQNGIFAGFEDRRFDPKGHTTRAQMATLMDRLIPTIEERKKQMN